MTDQDISGLKPSSRTQLVRETTRKALGVLIGRHLFLVSVISVRRANPWRMSSR